MSCDPTQEACAGLLSRMEQIEAVLKEVALQVRSLTDQTRAAAPAPARPEGGGTEGRNVVHAGDLRIDIDAHRVTLGNLDVPLTAIEFALLAALVERRDTVVARGTLLVEVWRRSEFTKTRTVDTHVKRLRDQLGSARRYIQTVHGIGYRFSEHRSMPRARAAEPRYAPAEVAPQEPLWAATALHR